MINKIKNVVDSRGITVYQFWKATGVTEPTAYRLYKDPFLIPSGKVLEAMHRAYPDTTPNDWLAFVSEEEKQKLKKQLVRSETKKAKAKTKRQEAIAT